MQDLNIALVQSELEWENARANLEHFTDKLDLISDADIIILPEMFTTGFSMAPASLAEEMEGKSITWMRDMARQKNAAITGSLIIKENGKFFNRLIWMMPDGSFTYYDKKHLFSMAGEEKVYTPGEEKLIVEYKGWKICPLVCYDLRFPVWIRNKEQYDLLIFVANWPEKRVHHWRKLLQARAIENQCYVAGVNTVGNDGNDIYYSGNSMMVNPQGEILNEAENKEAVLTLSLSYEDIIKTRRYMPFLKDMDSFSLNS